MSRCCFWIAVAAVAVVAVGAVRTMHASSTTVVVSVLLLPLRVV
jgi:hypothetical protein